MSGADVPPLSPDSIAASRKRYLQEQSDLRDQRMMTVFKTAVTTNPAARSEAMDIAKKLNLPDAALEENIDVAREMLRVREMQDLRQEFPSLDKRFENIDFAGLVHDDLGNIKAVESTIDWMKRHFGRGPLINEMGEIGSRMMLGSSTSDDTLRLQAIKRQLADEADSGFVGSALELAGQMVGPMAKSFAASTAAAGGVSLFSGPGAVVTAPAAFGTTFLATTFAQTARLEAGNAYIEMLDKGYDKDVAALGAGFVGLANGLLETVGTSIVTSPLRKAVMRRVSARLGAELIRPTTSAAVKTMAAEYLKSVFGEASTEAMQEMVNVVAEEAVRRGTDPNLPKASADEILSRVSDVFVKTAKGMALLGIPAPAIHYISDTNAVADAKEQMRFLRGLRKGSEESKVRQRSPGVFADYLRAQTKGTPVENVYINGGTFAEVLQQMQHSRDTAEDGGVGGASIADELDKLLPGTTAKINEAVRAGKDADVVLSLADVEAHLGGTEIGERLLQHSRIDQSAPSFAEAKQIEADVEADQAKAQKTLDEAQLANREFVQSAQRVEDSIRQQVAAAQPKLTADEVKSSAVFYRNVVVNLASEMKITPEEFYRRYPMRVIGGEVDQRASAEFDQLGNRKTDTPEFKAWFGDSKVVDAKGQPLTVYHATDREFSAFRRRTGDIGMHFGTAGQAGDRVLLRGADRAGTRTIPVYLTLRNPIRLTDPGLWTAENLIPQLRKLFDDHEVNHLETTASVRKFLQRKGYDGVVYRNTGEVAGGQALRDEMHRLRRVLDARLGRASYSISPDEQQLPEYKAFRSAYEAEQRHREENAEDSYIAFERTQIKSVNNRGTFDPNDANILKQYDRPNAESGSRAGSAAAGGLPRYGQPVEGATSVVGVHYSQQRRESLDARKFGTGFNAPERARVAGDAELAARAYFYVDDGSGVTPEIGVGPVEHRAQLDNLYDVAGDPRGLVARYRDGRQNGTMSPNDFEHSVLEAGFDGYIGALPDGQRVAVLIGTKHTAVPVQINESRASGSQQAEAGAVHDAAGVRGSVGALEQLRGQDLVDDAPLRGLPATVRVGTAEVAFGPHKVAREAAVRYAERAGIDYAPPRDYVEVSPARAKRIATAFEMMQHDPNNPDVRAAYDALARETLAQWEAIKETGLKVEFIEDVDPYALSPRGVITDVVENNHMWVFPTDAGFGGTESAGVDISGNPLLAIVPGETISGRPVRLNDIFRVVHDYFGHVKEGVGFRARGEENAWQQHMAMFSPLARKALTVETRGQNSWVNFGPFAESNRTASGADTQYAPQKIGLLPDWVVEEGYAGGTLAAGPQFQPKGTFSPKSLTTVLTSKADTSTFLHETAHYYLTVLADLASRPEGTERMRADMQTLLDWFGVADLATWNAMTLEQQRKHHEAFAYNFEVYMFEGKAPTPALKTLFDKFATWLRTLYKAIRGELNDVYKGEFGEDLPILQGEVRQVMDRMVASEEAVSAEIERRGMLPFFLTQEESGYSDEEWAAYLQLDREQKDEAIAEATRSDLRNLSWLSGAEGKLLRAAQKEHDDIRAQVRREVVAEVQQNPRDRARRWLRRGEVVDEDGTVHKEELGPDGERPVHKLDRTMVEQMLPPGTDLTPLAGMLRENGLNPDHVAEVFFGEKATGRQLLNALMEMRPFEDVVDARVDQRMLAEHAEFVPGTPEHKERINLALHNEARGRFLAAEQRTLDKSTKPVRLMVAAAKEAARRVLLRTKVGEIDPRAFSAAEDRLVLQLRRAQRQGDTEAVIDLKRRQLLHSQLVVQAYAAKAEVRETARDFAKVFRTDTKLIGKRNVDFVIAARWILARVGLATEKRKAAADAALQRVREHTPDALAEIEPILADVAQRARPFEEMTLQDFRDLGGLIDWLWARSKRELEIEVEGKRMLRKEAVAEMIAAMREIHGDAPIKGITTEEDRKALGFANTWAKLKRVESWARQMDGGKPNGPVTRFLWRPLRERYDTYMAERERLLVTVRDNLMALPLGTAKIEAPELIGAPVFNGTAELLGAVQHAGNSSNLRRLLLGYGWTEPQPNGGFNRARWDSFFARMLAEGVLKKEHLDYLQSVWDLNEKELRPLAQKVNREVYQLFFEEIPAEPIETPFGTYRGGYMPAKPDPDHPGNIDIKQRAGLDAIQQMELDTRSMLSAGRGFTVTRAADVRRPLLLDVRLQTQHLDEVLRFIYMQPALHDAASILKDSDFAGYLNAVDPAAIKSMLMPWLEDVATNRVTKPSSMPALDKFFGFLRRSTGLNFMFGSVRNAAQQFTGITNVLIYVKPRFVKAALMRYYTELGTTKWVKDRSKAMKVRLDNNVGQIQEDINLLLDPSWMGKLGRWTNKYGYFAQRFVQEQVDVVAWLAAYQQELDRAGADETDAAAVQRAISEADAVVRLTQGSVTPADTAAYERSSAFARLFTQFSSYFNAVLNQITSAPEGSRARAALLGLALPALGSAVIAAAASGGDEFDDKDGDGYSDEVIAWLFATQARAAAGVVPGFGPLLAQAASGDRRAADRLQPAPAWSAVQALARSVSNLTSGDLNLHGRQISDLFTVFAVATGIPLGGAGRSLGYYADVEQGRVVPRDTFDYLRGVASGRASVGTRQ